MRFLRPSMCRLPLPVLQLAMLDHRTALVPPPPPPPPLLLSYLPLLRSSLPLSSPCLFSCRPTPPLLPPLPPFSKSFSDPRGYERCIANPYRYVGSQRLQVVVEMLRLARQVQEALPKVTCPWLILHGEKDEVTDPETSKRMYAVSPSQDKTLHMVEGALHQLMAGEPPPVRDALIKEVAEWVIKRGHAR